MCVDTWWNERRLDMFSDVMKTLGLLAVPSGIADAILVRSRVGWDVAGMVAGILCLAVALHLTGKIKGGRL